MSARNQLFGPQPAPGGDPRGILVDLDARYVPGMLALLESKKYQAAWYEGDWSAGYDAYSKAQWRMLMDASTKIIDELRQLRGPLVGDELVPTDPTITAIYPGVSLRQILYNDTSGLEGINEKLQLLVDNAAAQNSEEQLAALQQIIVLLGGVV